MSGVARTPRLQACLALALALPGLVLASCGGSSSPAGSGTTTQAGPPRVGTSQRVRTPDTTLVVTVRRVIDPLRGSGALLSPGDSAAGVEMAVRNTGKGVYDSSSESDVALPTSSGALAEPAFASHGQCATSEIDFLKLVEPGESRSGCVAFDVPRGDRPVAVRFVPERREALGHTWLIAG
jgi:uncharacterized protein DUF4352